MPPELIVTPAQVYEMQSFSDIEKLPSKDTTSKGKHEDSPSLPRKGDNSWSPERAEKERRHQPQKFPLAFRCELSHEIQTRLMLQPSITLQQTVWTGVDYCTDCTKNIPLSWGRAQSSNDSLLRSCSQKLTVLKKNKHTKKDKNAARADSRNKLQKTADEDDSTPPLQNSKKKVKLKSTKKIKSNGDQNLEIIMNIEEDSKPEISVGKEGTSQPDDRRKLLDSTWSRGKKSGKQPVARSRFRKGGIVATATIHSYVEAESDENDGSLALDKKKKKKKRKLMGMNRRVRKVIATVVATSQKPENEQGSASTKR